jgi:hypothetical protein
MIRSETWGSSWKAIVDGKLLTSTPHQPASAFFALALRPFAGERLPVQQDNLPSFRGLWRNALKLMYLRFAWVFAHNLKVVGSNPTPATKFPHNIKQI